MRINYLFRIVSILGFVLLLATQVMAQEADDSESRQAEFEATAQHSVDVYLENNVQLLNLTERGSAEVKLYKIIGGGGYTGHSTPASRGWNIAKTVLGELGRIVY